MHGLSSADGEMTVDCENCRHLTVVGLHDTGPWGYWTSLAACRYAVTWYTHTTILRLCESGEECDLATAHYKWGFVQGYLGSQPERGALGSAVIAGGVKMKLLAILVLWEPKHGKRSVGG